MENQISKLRNHYIICGYGRIGSVLCKVLHSHSIDFVVIECNPESVENLEKEKLLFIPMDATDEEALEKAGITHAKGLVTAVHSDADNVYITLSARGLRPDLFILSRASNEKAVQKLKKAGATRVVTPYQLGGRRMAQEIIRPTVVDFIDSTTMDMKFGLVMEEAKVKEGSSFIGKTLIESNLRKDFGVIIVAIRKKDGKMIFNPTSEHTLNIDDIIVVLGKKDDVMRMINVL